MSKQLPITNFINVSVSEASPGLGEYSTSNLSLFTDEAPNLGTFGSLGYASYVSPTQVGIDFGTSSKTYQMANAVFSQQPNILSGGGQLIIVLMTNSLQTVSFSGVPASGSFELQYGGTPTASISWSDSAATVQTKLRAIPALAGVLVTGSIATSLVVQMAGVYSPSTLLSTANSLMTSAPAAVTITITPVAAETLGAAITRASSLVQFFGIIANESLDVIGQANLLAAAAVIQPLNKIGFFVSHTEADIQAGGMLDLLRTGSFTQSRGLYYGDSSDLNDILMMAAYAGRALSVNFDGSNTTLTMNLKTLNGIQPDPTITQTILNEAIAAGADVYASFQGVSAVYCVGANQYFDAVYNQLWFAGALSVAAFNYLQEAQTKVPQTESAMDGFKGALRAVCEQAVTNQYLAPGTWTSPEIFGNPALFVQNISQRGYYIFSQPISQQSVAARNARQSPVVQIAGKAAGAIQSADILVNINA